MKNSIVMAILLSICSLSACVRSSLVVGQPGASINSEDVVVYFIDRPACNFETVTHISMNGGLFHTRIDGGGNAPAGSQRWCYRIVRTADATIGDKGVPGHGEGDSLSAHVKGYLDLAFLFLIILLFVLRDFIQNFISFFRG